MKISHITMFDHLRCA